MRDCIELEDFIRQTKQLNLLKEETKIKGRLKCNPNPNIFK